MKRVVGCLRLYVGDLTSDAVKARTGVRRFWSWRGHMRQRRSVLMQDRIADAVRREVRMR